MQTIFTSFRRAQAVAPRFSLSGVAVTNRVLQPLHLRSLPLLSMRVQHFGTSRLASRATAQSGLSQVTQDYQTTMSRQFKEDKPVRLSTAQRQGNRFKVPDYNVSENQVNLQLRLKQQDTMKKGEHPIEAMARVARAKSDLYASLKPNQLLLTNLPLAEAKELISEQSVADFLVQNVHKDLQVNKVNFHYSLSTENLKQRTSYIKVEVGSKRQAQLVKSNLRKTWLHDALIKIKTLDDAKAEAFDNRTIILNGLPNHLNTQGILDYFGPNAGAIVGIELPQENSKLRDLRREVVQLQDNPKQIDKETSRRRAMIAVQDSLKAEENANSGIQSMTVESQKLEQERISAIMRLITRLQAEGKSVMEQKIALLSIKEQSTFDASISAEQTKPQLSAERLREMIEANKDSVTKSLNYLRKNQEEVALKAFSDPLQDLLRLGKEELAVTYDRLIEALGDREKAIEARLRKSVEHYGLTERILQRGKDFSKELEDVPTVGGRPEGNVNPEDIISVGQQVYNVIQAKNISAEDKVQQLLTRTLNPFITSGIANFNEGQILDTTNPAFDQEKFVKLADPRVPASQQNKNPQGSDFLPEQRGLVDELIKESRGEVNTPFDELYHQQKQVIQDVIEAENALKKKMESLPDPQSSMSLDLTKVTPEQRNKVQDLLDGYSSAFNTSQKRQNDKLVSSKLQDLSAGSQAGAYRFDYSETTDLQQQVEQGLVSKKYATMMQQLFNESQDVNLGYAFITFSHADEARLFLLMNDMPHYDMEEIEVLLKSHLDHSSMDMNFFMANARNAAQTVEEIQAVRDAREKLREFEKNLDSQLPSRKRLQKFRRFTQSLIEEHESLTKQNSYYGEMRTQLEKDRLDRKVRDFEAANPDIDLTAIYDNEKTESARKALHKKAYASYKAFHFLKGGVKRGEELLQDPAKEELSTAKRRLKDNDPYNFPALDKTVKSVLNPDIDEPRLTDVGDPITRPGRRVNGYTESEYLESYYGKDGTRRLQTETLEDPLYIPQKSLKELYPLNDFLKKPAMMAEQEKLKALGLEYDPAKFPHMLPKDDDLANYQRYRTEENDAYDELKKEKYFDPESEARDGVKAPDMGEMVKSLIKEHRNRYKRENKDLQFKNQMHINADELAEDMDDLDKEMLSGKYGQDERKDWFEWLKDPAITQDEVADKFDEENAYELLEYFDKYGANTTETIEQEMNQGSRESRDGEAGGDGGDELQDAKFEANYDGDQSGAQPDAQSEQAPEKSVRRQRRQRQKQSQPAEAKGSGDAEAAIEVTSKNKDVLKIIKELNMLKQGKGKQGQDSSLSEQLQSVQYQAEMSRADYETARAMASMEPKEREQLLKQKEKQRIALLEDLLAMSKERDGLDEASLTQLANLQSSEQVDIVRGDDLYSQTLGEREYILRSMREQGNDPAHIPDEGNIARNGNLDQKVQLDIDRRKRGQRLDNVRVEAEQRMSGAWFKKYQTQADLLEDDNEYTATRTTGRTLGDFIDDREGAQSEQEDDDDDIFRQYQEMASRNQYKTESQARQPVYPQLKEDEMKPKMPSFEEYFSAESEGVHPFDRITNSYQDDEVSTQQEQEAELEREKQLYQRQLLGKLMGKTLTPREYELVAGMQRDQDMRIKNIMDVNNKEFLENRQRARLSAEIAEKVRRQKVLAGEWSESESHTKIQEMLTQAQDEHELIDRRQFERDSRLAIAHLRQNYTHTIDHEKEYHFDEGVGVSLEEHTEDLKKRYPLARVETRRDRDGFAIVKVTYKPEFKYDLDKIMAMNEQEGKKHMAETLEAIFQVQAGGLSPQENLQNQGPEQIQAVMNALQGNFTGDSGKMSDKTALAIRQLAKERAEGMYRDDLEGFKDALKTVMEEAEADQSEGSPAVNPATGSANIFEEIYKDREQFRADIALQLRLRINHHLRGKKRTESDYVKPRHNEASLLANLGRQVDSLENQVVGTDEKDENFDRAAFDDLKRELSQRKKLKEDMLSGTLPRFKPYLRI